MAIYKGDTKVAGGNFKLDGFISDTSSNPVPNYVIANALLDVGYSTWQKPADWIDIRSGAADNSAYFLVAHSTPTESGGTYTVATYSTFALSAEVTTAANSYDVYVDGLKVATTASAATTTIDWGALYTAGTISSGYNVTTPSAMVSHIIRVTPAVSTDNITVLRTQVSADCGLLWAHLELTNRIDIRNFTSTHCKILQAVTAKDDEIKVTGTLTNAFYGASSLEWIAKIVGNNESFSFYQAFYNASKLKRLRLKDIWNTTGGGPFYQMSALEKIETENAYISLLTTGNTFTGARSLKSVPPLKGSTAGSSVYISFSNLASLEPTVLDMSIYPNTTRLLLFGSSTYFSSGLKGVTVSSSGGFTGSSPQINVSYTGLDRAALVNLFNSLPTVTGSQVCNITGATGADDLTASDLAIATGKGWTVTR